MMISNIWTLIKENAEFSSNIVIVIIVLMGFLGNFMVTKNDFSELRNQVNRIDKKVSDIRNNNILSKNRVQNLRDDLNSAEKKLVEVKEISNKLNNRYGRFSVKIEDLQQDQDRIEKKINRYHDR